MNGRATITIEALVDPVERPGLVVAAEQLSDCLGRAAEGPAWPVHLKFLGSLAEASAAPALSALVVSLLPDTRLMNEPIAQTEARWRAGAERLLASGAPVFVCTVFRHINERPNAGTASPMLERIRRLDRMALDLSHDLGVAIIDIDRAFAHIGGRSLQTDFRLSGVLAAEVAGHTIVWSLLSSGLDDVIDPDLQETAKAALGDLKGIDAVIARRMALRKAAAEAAAQTGAGR
jgi:hypothetical protein